MKNILFFLVIIFTSFLVSCTSKVKNPVETNRLPQIFPDYSGIVIPPNIAPLNFRINEPGREFEVRFYNHKSNKIIIKSKRPVIQFGLKQWHKFLQESAGSEIFADIFVKTTDGQWQKFETIKNQVSLDPIDNHLAYRLINTGYVFWSNLGIYQRNLENFEEKPILENKSFDYGCLNCHSFCKNNPESMLLHIRAIHGGTIVKTKDKLLKIDTKNKYTLNAGVYPSWHPDGKRIAFSVNNINQHFCNGETRIEVSDEFSDLIVYNVENNTITTSVKVSTDSRENLPVWSPDGKFLYFISAPPATTLENRISIKYELLRIAFDPENETFGDIDTIISSKMIGKSISFPKVSPNGKYLIFCVSETGYFTIHHADTDLYLLNLETGNYSKMDINSNQTDSYHCFSSTGSWMVFSSKRMDGLFTRPFFTYLDDNGNASKPFVLPQESPDFYNTFIQNYNIPELITGEVKVSPIELREEVLQNPVPAKLDPRVDTLYMKEHLKN